MGDSSLSVKPKIAFIGMSHLGLVSSIVGASKGFQIICYDNCPKKISRLSDGDLGINEPKLFDYLIKSKNNIKWSNNLQDIVQCKIIYLSIDIKTDSNGKSDLSEINDYLSKLDKILKNDNELVILSQVNPGFTRNVRVKAKNIYYQVETLVFGNAIDRALNPERITIGLKEKDRNLSKNFKVFLDSFKCPLIIMNYESAELTKISINLFLIAQVSVTNTVSSLCEKIGADWTDMVPSLKLDKRIGQYCYLKPGLGISGGNLERDMATIMEISSYKQIDNSLINTFIQNSHDRKKWVFENLKSVYPDLNKKLKISILGLSYKENTDSVKNSPSIETIKLIPNVSIYAYDPVVKWNVKWHNNATILNNLYDTLNDCDAMLIMTPWEEFKTINLKKVKKLMKGRLIIDPYCMLLNDKNVHRDFKYIYMGGSQNNKDLKNGNKLTKKLT